MRSRSRPSTSAAAVFHSAAGGAVRNGTGCPDGWQVEIRSERAHIARASVLAVMRGFARLCACTRFVGGRFQPTRAGRTDPLVKMCHRRNVDPAMSLDFRERARDHCRAFQAAELVSQIFDVHSRFFLSCGLLCRQRVARAGSWPNTENQDGERRTCVGARDEFLNPLVTCPDHVRPALYNACSFPHARSASALL